MMDEDVEEKRFRKLGFKPQKENVYNKLLPYAQHLDEESTKLFAEIKNNLVKSVLAREMRPGCALWTSKLNKYIKVYGLKFSKEDHIALIKLFYELITIPDLEPTRVNKSAITLTILLKKRYLISRDELQLEWRPLYNLCVRTMEKSKPDIGMYRYFSTYENSIFEVIKACRIYFPASATQEILDEFRPDLCPFSGTEMGSAIQYLEMFLPICVKPEEADISYKLWLKEFMTLWDVCHNANQWENHMMWLLARLNCFNMGHIDWEPYVPMMFSRFIRVLQLPVVFKQKQLCKQHKIDIFPIAIWITGALNGDNNSVFYQFEKFMQTLESYFYQANNGRWTGRLRELLRKLSFYFVQRVHCERYKTPVWDMNIVDSFRLTDADIDRFVNILKPCIEQAMFSRMGQQETSLTLQYLASLRPNIIVPITLDKLYSSMDSLTEPHKLTSSMMGVIAVGRYMVQGPRNNYPEGPTHVIPLLMALLPGIDPNDIRKSYVTFSFIVHFVNMIPLINSSDAHNYYDLTEEEHSICEATANFEDFVVQLFDKLCIWVESSSLDFVRQEIANNSNNSKNRSETFAENAIGSVITVVLSQCSPAIFTVALKKMFNFVRSKIMEIYISGKMLAVACYCFARVNPKETLKLFIPHLCDRIEELLNENPNVEKDENIDDELLYNLLILSELANARSELLEYIDKLIPILDRTLHMTSLKASPLAARLLDLMMYTLTYIQPVEVRSSPIDYGTPTKDYLPIRDWGKAHDVKDLKINWYLPGPKEIEVVQMLINRYLVPELAKLDGHINGEAPLSRQELKSTLKIINSALSCHSVLPIWEESPHIQLVDSCLAPSAFNLKVSGSGSVTMPDGQNVRKVVIDTLHRLQKKLLETDEGDTQSIKNLIQVYNIILFNKTHGHDFESHWKNFHMSKKMLEDRLHQKKMHLRHVLIDRVVLHQEFRTESRNCSFTETHKQILLDLFELSVSRYSDVRIAAQSKLISVVSYFPYSYTLLKDRIIDILKSDSEKNHEAFKGCLYILISPKNSPIVARHDWEFIKDIWPQIVLSKPSEKLSIINLSALISESVHRFFPTIAIKLLIPESCTNAALELAKGTPKCVIEPEFQRVIDNGAKALQLKSMERRKAYETTMDALLDACENGNLHWRYHSMALNFLKDLVHFDVKYNARIVRYFLKCLISDSITIRKTAMRVLVFITVQNKPEFKKITIDPLSVAGVSDAEQSMLMVKPGYRKDNEWLLYSKELIPKNSKQWDEHRYVHDVFVGYYAWPKKLQVYAPYADQPTAAKRMHDMTDTEKEMYQFFMDEKNVDQLIKYLSMEEKKGSDQFNGHRFLVYKNLFKTFEDALLPVFLPHIQRLVQDKQESSHRCASELIAGIVRGSKHWSYEKSEQLWKCLIPVFDVVFANMSSEVINDWSLCFTMALEWRDPKRYHWLFEYLLDDPLKEQTSFIASARLQMLFIALNQQHWRNTELLHRLLHYFEPHLSHPFQNIREKISILLCLILSTDLVFPEGTPTKGPLISDFFQSVMPQLNKLYCQLLKKVQVTNGNGIEGGSNTALQRSCDRLELMEIGSDEDKETAIRLFKIVSRYITQSVVRMNFSTLTEFFSLIPLASVLQSNDVDEEVATCSVNLLVVLAQAMTLPQHIPKGLEAIEKVARGPFWSARSVIAELLSVFVFYNMPSFHSNPEWVQQVQRIVLDLMEDEKPEVRENSARVLSGLIHCQFLPRPSQLLDTFKQMARTKIKKGNNTPQSIQTISKNLRTRHAGVLGLCAFISSHPYDVPDFLPAIFACLGPHLSDPQPIPATIRKTLGDFKRTHHDNWELHKLKFTEDELSVLSDLTVPPSYYA